MRYTSKAACHAWRALSLTMDAQVQMTVDDYTAAVRHCTHGAGSRHRKRQWNWLRAAYRISPSRFEERTFSFSFQSSVSKDNDLARVTPPYWETTTVMQAGRWKHRNNHLTRTITEFDLFFSTLMSSSLLATPSCIGGTGGKVQPPLASCTLAIP